MSIKYIVTGTGRCGTMFLSKYLTSAGINCGHEVIFTNSGMESVYKNLLINGGLVADASYMAAPFLNNKIFNHAKIIHLVRDPIKVINSFVSGYKYFLSALLDCKQYKNVWTYEYPPGADPDFKFMNFMYSHVLALQSVYLSPIERAALFYIEWNKIIEKGCSNKKYLFFPIESDLSNLNKFIDIEDSDKLYKDKKTNSYEYEMEYSLSSINSYSIRNNLYKIGSKYGYFKKGIL